MAVLNFWQIGNKKVQQSNGIKFQVWLGDICIF